MNVLTDLVSGIVDSVTREILRKTTGTGKRRRRRKTLTAAERLSRIERLIRPAKRQVSRKKSTRVRSPNQQRRVRAKTATHRKSLRRGAAKR